MKTTNMEAINMILERIGEDFAFLSDGVKLFLKSNLEEDDIEDFGRLINYYQLLVKETEQYDDFDNELLEKLKNNLQLLKLHLE
jgi:hypothetical protein